MVLGTLQLDILGQLQADLKGGRAQRLQDQCSDECIESTAGQRLAMWRTIVDLVARAVVTKVTAVIAVAGDHATTATATIEQVGEQGRAAAWDAFVLVLVCYQLPLVLLIPLPANVGRPAILQQYPKVIRYRIHAVETWMNLGTAGSEKTGKTGS